LKEEFSSAIKAIDEKSGNPQESLLLNTLLAFVGDTATKAA
jgi:hypothetical protein